MNIFEIPRGTKQQKLIPVPDFDAELPVSVIRGVKDGPNVLITAGVHNEEYVGIETANRLSLALEPEKICGCVAIIHTCNPTGFAALSRDLVPEDGKNLNRCFPGSADGSAAHRLAHFITEDFLKPAFCHIDLHCGGGREELTPHVYYQAIEPGPLSTASQKLARLMDANYMVAVKSYTGSAFSHAGMCGVPAILMERGGMAVWTEAEIDAYLADVYRILHHLHVWPEAPAQKETPQDIEIVDYYNAEAGGCWYPEKRTGDRVRSGEALGTVKDAFGKPLFSLYASVDSVVLYQMGSLSVREGELLAACGQL